MATSQNGYNVVKAEQVVKWTIPGHGKSKGDVNHVNGFNGWTVFMLIHFATYYAAKIERLSGKVLDDWLWAPFRYVRGSVSAVSNHASSSAIDLNATVHVRGKRNTFNTLAARAIRLRLRTIYGGLLRWGADYHTTVDDMHFEVNAPFKLIHAWGLAHCSSPYGLAVLKANPMFVAKHRGELLKHKNSKVRAIARG